jgi:hypothetical protein
MNRFETEAIIMALAFPPILALGYLFLLLFPVLRRLLSPGD